MTADIILEGDSIRQLTFPYQETNAEEASASAHAERTAWPAAASLLAVREIP